MIDALFWSMILMAIGIGLIALELFLPSGGVLSVLAAIAVIGSVVIAFTGGWISGLIVLAVTMILIPTILAAAVRWWPYTPIGRMLVLHTPESEEDVLPDDPVYRELQGLVGRRGSAKTKLLPSGAVTIDGRSYDAVSQGGAIDPGQTIRVTAVRTNRIIVVPTSGLPPITVENADVLDQPAETFGLESFEDPTG